VDVRGFEPLTPCLQNQSMLWMRSSLRFSCPLKSWVADILAQMRAAGELPRCGSVGAEWKTQQNGQISMLWQIEGNIDSMGILGATCSVTRVNCISPTMNHSDAKIAIPHIPIAPYGTSM